MPPESSGDAPVATGVQPKLLSEVAMVRRLFATFFSLAPLYARCGTH